jgi:hypothetical protein
MATNVLKGLKLFPTELCQYSAVWTTNVLFLFVVYLTTLSVDKTTQRQIIG